jgi:hypothetical protein
MQVTSTHGGVILIKKKQRIARTAKPPLWVTLLQVAGDPVTWEVFVEYGHVVPRHNASTDTGEPILISDLPTNDARLTVTENTKLWVELTINTDGKCTEAAFQHGTTWEEDVAPQLKGGDDATGEEGFRYIRIAEIIADPDSVASPPPLISNQLLTGHIDHFQNELVENVSGSGARVLKEFDLTSAAWMLRLLTAGAGITITENASDIEIEATAASGWWGTVSWLFVPAGGGGSSQNLILTFENGSLKTVSLDGSGITGTEAAPGDAELEVNF